MRIKFALDAFANQSEWRFLDNIIGKVADGWHVWQVDVPEAIEMSGWLEGRAWLRELFQKASLASAYPMHSKFPKRELIVGYKPDLNVLPPQQAAEYAGTPLTILMENRFTDGLFIGTVLEFLAPDFLKEHRNNAPDSIQYDSPGGIGELPKLVCGYIQKAINRAIPLRIVVFCDSDAEIPGQMQDAAIRLVSTCSRYCVPCWILRKRSIENYIPDEVLDAWVPSNPDYEKRRLVDAVKRLNLTQRDHFPMKKGLDVSKANSVVQELYREANDADKDELKKGFGKDVIEKLGEYRGALTSEALRRRDGQGELDCLVALIVDEL